MFGLKQKRRSLSPAAGWFNQKKAARLRIPALLLISRLRQPSRERRRCLFRPTIRPILPILRILLILRILRILRILLIFLNPCGASANGRRLAASPKAKLPKARIALIVAATSIFRLLFMAPSWFESSGSDAYITDPRYETILDDACET